MALVALPLPPPVIFEYNETLHAIPLPPLATFLTSLHQPEHLVRLHDILDRYRTPKSYHRIDVRVVGSSELPPSSPPIVGGGGEGGDDVREKGEPVILPQGVTKEEYTSTTYKDTFHIQTTSPPSHTVNTTDISKSLFNNPQPEAGPSRLPTPPIDPQLIPPTPKRHKPHRIRELRLDLHTLDAAALFALETWRREIMELPKLDMEYPDSIWYKDPNPPSPIRVEVERGDKKKRGRPRKSVIVVGEEEEEGYEGLKDLLVGEEGFEEKVVEESLGEETILKALEVLEGVDDSLMDIVPLGGMNGVTTAVDEEMMSRSPSPDIILGDRFDAREEADPDFVPLASPPPPVFRAIRSRQSLPIDGVKRVRGRPRKSEPGGGFQAAHYEPMVVKGVSGHEDIVDITVMDLSGSDGQDDLIDCTPLGHSKRRARMLVVEIPLRGKRRRMVRFDDPTEEEEVLETPQLVMEEMDVESSTDSTGDAEDWDFLKQL
jgi:hypothetical protein